MYRSLRSQLLIKCLYVGPLTRKSPQNGRDSHEILRAAAPWPLSVVRGSVLGGGVAISIIGGEQFAPHDEICARADRNAMARIAGL